MHIEHFEKGIRYTDRELLRLARKVGKLAQYCKSLKNGNSRIRVEAEKRATKKEKDSMKMMITIFLPSQTLRAESRQPNILDAIDRCCEKLQHQIVRYKERHNQKPHRRGGMVDIGEV